MRGQRRKRRKHWAKSFGPYKCRVRVFATPGGVLYYEARTEHGITRKSLKHRDRARATRWAREEQAKLALGVRVIETPAPTVARVLRGYRLNVTPGKSRSSRYQDTRAEALWTKVLGAEKDLSKLTRAEWAHFITARASGAIDPRGEPVETAKERRPVRARAVAADLEWLRGVINWAMNWNEEETDGEVRYLMRENPIRGFPIPDEPNVQRPVATQDRYEAIRKVSDRVTMDVRRDGKRRAVRSYLSELLDLVNGTGRRITAVLELRHEDLRLADGKHGAIVWPAVTDKMAKAWTTPINAAVRAAIDRIVAERPGIGRAYLFPSPRNAARAVSRDLVSGWLERAETLAKVPKHAGSLWHAYRRKWASERKHLPDVDVMAAGGWSDLASLKTAYQHADAATMYRVVSEPAELREAKA